MRSFLLAIVICIAIIISVEAAYRLTGGFPTIVPGMTSTEFQWKIRRSEPQPTIYLVGDSRVGWGFAEKVFNKCCQALNGTSMGAINAGLPGISVQSIIEYILQTVTEPKMMVINYSPAGFYIFDSQIDAILDLKPQDILDDKINTFLSAKIYTFNKGHSLWRHFKEFIKKGKITPKIDWISRIEFSDGFFNGKLVANDRSPVDPAKYQLESYQEMIRKKLKDPEDLKKRKDGIIETINYAKKKFWTVIIVRFPLANHMREIENELPEEFSPEVIAKQLSLRFIDYNYETDYLVTQDQSHLTPDSARKLAVILAKDLSSFSLLPK